ncbi:MAG: hypothetical protein AAB366_02115 [Patescibacteria group bacterium]
MTTEDYNLYKLLIEAIIAIVSLLVGGVMGIYVENRWKIVKKVKSRINQKGYVNQAVEVIDSPHSSPQNAGGDALRQEGAGVLASIKDSPGASINFANNEPRVGSPDEALGTSSLPTESERISLSSNQAHIYQKVQEILQKLNKNTTFAARYQNAIRHLNSNNAQVCASEYHSAFLDVVPIILERSTYGSSAPTKDNLDALNKSFEQIRVFMNTSSHDDATLGNTLKSFEDAILILLGYL